ncbi:MAG: hypothetical protein MK102_09460 [Fuerstiella sp.]|nr:hypothetical protein [Fuerstiella sp.]
MNGTQHTRHRNSRYWFWCTVVLAAIHLAMGLHAATRLSPTHDEYWHLAIGVDILKTGRFDQDPINPPLVRILAALPLLPLVADFNSQGIAPGEAAAFGDRLIDTTLGDPVWLWFRGRMIVLGFSLVAGYIVVTWTRELWGDAAAVVAGVFWFLNPTVLAHSALVTHDIPATTMFVICLRCAWHFGRRPGYRLAAGIGFVLGMALLTKFTSILLVGLIPGIIAIAWTRGDGGISRARRSVRLTVSACIVTVVSLITVNAGYLGTGFGTSLSAIAPASQQFRMFVRDFPGPTSLPLPLPADWVRGLDQLQFVMEHQHPVFLNGEWSFDGFRSYYLWALACKTEHGFQAFLVAGLLISVLRRTRKTTDTHRVRKMRRQGFCCCLLVVFALMTIASLGRNQLGIRYILPAFPFLAMIAGTSITIIGSKQMFSVAMCILAFCCAAWSLRHHPNHIAYFNEWSDGPNGGRLHLIDSNVDWGQGLIQLAEYTEQNARKLDGLVYFGTGVPTDWGLASSPLPPDLPEPGRYGVSVNFLMGRPHSIRDRDGSTAIDFAKYSYFRYLEPQAQIGASICVFEVSQQDAEMIRRRVRMPR